MSSTAFADARSQWAEAYRNSEFYKGTSGDQHYGACPCCGGEDRFWIYFKGKHASTFSCRGCEPKKHTSQAAEITRVLNELVGIRPFASKWQILRTHEYRTSKGNVRHVKGIPPDKATPTTFWQHWDESEKKWQRGMGRKVKIRDLLWNHWTVKPDHTVCVVCEGEKDATLLHELLKKDMPHACFVSGAGGAGNPAMNLAPLTHIKEFFVLFDADEEGRQGAIKYAARIREVYPNARILHYAPPGESKEDWGDIITEAKASESDKSTIAAYVAKRLAEAMTKAKEFTPASLPVPQSNGTTVLDVGEYTDDTIPLGWTDDEIAEWILQEKLGARIEKGVWKHVPVIFDQSSGEWYFCRAGVWKQIDFPKVVAYFMAQARKVIARDWEGDKEKLLRVLASHVKRDQVVKIIQRYVGERGEKIFDQNSWLVCGCPPKFDPNTIIEDPSGNDIAQPAQVWDLSTGQLRNAKIGDFIRSTLGTPLPSRALVDSKELDAEVLGMHVAKDCPAFWELLGQISSYIPDADAPDGTPQADLSWMLHMCEWIGQCLTADISPEKFLFFTGDGSNGKGLLAELLMELAGSLGHIAPDGLFKPTRTAHRQEQAVLEGKHILIADEQKARIDTGLLKSWTGGMPITADHKGGKSITFPVKFTVILLSNEMPRFPSANESMRRRLVGIPFDISFKDRGGHFQRRAKEDIFRSIREEFPRLAYLCLSMYRAVKLRGNQFSVCSRVDAKSTELLLSMNRVQEWIEACLHLGPDYGGVSTKDLYSSYKAFMKENNYRGVLQSKAFTAEVRNVVLQKQLDMKYGRIGRTPPKPRGFNGCALKAKDSNGLLGSH